MRIEVIEGGRADGTDLVVMAGKKRQSRFADFEEFHYSDPDKAHKMRASRGGVRIQPQPLRMLGHEQARLMGATIIKAADEAERRGAPAYLLGG